MTGFIVFSLPRSRSAWLSMFLGKDLKVGHDIGIECDRPEDFVSALQPGMLAGTCETGAGFAWPLVRVMMPQSKIIVVRRKVHEVIHSLSAVGFTNQEQEMEERDRLLTLISASPGVTTIGYDDLDKSAVLEWLYGDLTGKPLDLAWLNKVASVNIQLKMKDRLARLAGRANAIANLKAQVRQRVECLH